MDEGQVARRREARRRWAAVVVFGVSVVAIGATSAAYTQINVPDATGTLHLDADHPIAMARVVVGLSAETQTGGPQKNIQLVVDRLGSDDEPVATGVPGASPTVVPPPTATPAPAPGGAPVQLIVRAAVPAPDPSAAYSAGTGAQAWEANVAIGQPVTLPIQCSAGPCQRAFWLIGQLPAGTAATNVIWHVGGSLGYPGDWPSGAGASIAMDPEVRFEGPAPVLAVSTPTETVHLDGTRPTAARLVELTMDAAGIHADGSPAAALTVSGQPVGRPSAGYPQVLLLDGPGASDPTLPNETRPPLLQPGGDPFVGCPAGSPCTRHVMVLLATAGVQVDLPWSITLRRADVVDAWSAPADMSAVVQRAWDVDAKARPSTVHLEGDVSLSSTQPRAQAGIQLQTRTASEDPYAQFLPVPGSLTVQVSTSDAPAASGQYLAFVSVSALQPGPARGGAAGQSALEGGSSVIEMNPMISGSATCLVGEACPLVAIAVSGPSGPNASASYGTYHWTLDAQVYPYEEVPLELSASTSSVPLP